jgi:hypothetical protein
VTAVPTVSLQRPHGLFRSGAIGKEDTQALTPTDGNAAPRAHGRSDEIQAAKDSTRPAEMHSRCGSAGGGNYIFYAGDQVVFRMTGKKSVTHEWRFLKAEKFTKFVVR